MSRFILFFTLFLISLFSCNQEQEKKKQAQERLLREQFVRDSIHTADSLFQLTQPIEYVGAIEPGDGMFQALMGGGVNQQTTLNIINTLRDEVELTSLRAGDAFSIFFDRKDSTVLKFEFRPHPALIHRVIRNTPNDDSTSTGWHYEQEEKPTTWSYRLIQSTLEDGSTLDQSLKDLGIPRSWVGVINGVLLCKVSFRTDARAGDTFRILLAERYYQDTLIEGKVMYTRYKGRRAGDHEAWRYDDGDPKSTYTAHYTENGEALIHSGLRYPVDRLHISSSYGYRIHPVTGKRAFHNGVDYAARTGTPVYAVAPGKVVQSGFSTLGGNTVAIRHSDGYTSYYLHLSSRSVNVGTNVRSRQIIGKAGATGRVTGPHLHFSFKKPNGQWMNPLQKRMIATPKLQGERLQKLLAQVDSTRTILKDLELKAPFPTPMPDSIRTYKDSIALAIQDSIRRDSLAKAAK